MTYPILVKPSFFPEIQAGRTNSSFSKTFLEGYVFVLNIFVTTAQNENKKFLKLYFNLILKFYNCMLNYRKLLE